MNKKILFKNLIGCILVLLFVSKVYSETFIIDIYYMSPEKIAGILKSEFNVDIKSDETKKTVSFDGDNLLYDKILKRIEEIDVKNSAEAITSSSPTESKKETRIILFKNLVAYDFQIMVEEKFNVKVFIDKKHNGMIITDESGKLDVIESWVKLIDKEYPNAVSEEAAAKIKLERAIIKLNFLDVEKAIEYIREHFFQSVVSANYATKSIIVSAPANELIEIKKMISQLDVSGQNIETEIIPIYYHPVDKIFQIIDNLYKPRNVEIDLENRTLCVSDNRIQLDKIKRFITDFDVEPPTILVEGTILSVSIGKAKEFGMKYTQQGYKYHDSVEFTDELDEALTPPGTGKTTGTKVIGSFQSGVALTNVLYQFTSSSGKVHDISLRALIDNNIAKSVLKPHITFVSGSSGLFEQNENIPYTTKDDAGNVVTEIMTVGLTLTVGGIAVRAGEPDKNGNIPYKIIITELRLTDGRSTGANGASNETLFESKQIVKDGELIIIGGAMRNTEDKYISKVPILGDIPIIKYLFNYKDNKDNSTEMLALLRLTVVDQDSYKHKVSQFTSSKELRPIEFGGDVNDSIREHPLKTSKWSSKIIYKEKGGYFERIDGFYSEEKQKKVYDLFKDNIRNRIKLVQEWNNIDLVKQLVNRDKGLKDAFIQLSSETGMPEYDILLISRHLGAIHDNMFLIYYEFLKKNKLLDNSKKK